MTYDFGFYGGSHRSMFASIARSVYYRTGFSVWKETGIKSHWYGSFGKLEDTVRLAEALAKCGFCKNVEMERLGTWVPQSDIEAMMESQRGYRPARLWTQDDPTPGVEAYFGAHQGEFYVEGIKSAYPYRGSKWWKDFEELETINPDEGYHRFEGRGAGSWTLCDDEIENGLTADLLAAANLLGGSGEAGGTHGPAGGYGVDTGEVWVGLLDGGVGVGVHVGQDESTNEPEGWQRTTIRGPRAFRCLLELLGFDFISEKLTGEPVTPSHQEIINMVTDLLAKSPHETGTHV
jgi:hypothetical protein